jgi:hypothetical protein
MMGIFKGITAHHLTNGEEFMTSKTYKTGTIKAEQKCIYNFYK